MASDAIIQAFSTNGDGTGVINMATTAAAYTVTPPANKIYRISSVNIYIRSNTKPRADRYGDTATLTNGVLVTAEDAGGILTMITPIPIKVTGHWATISALPPFLSDFQGAEQIIVISLTFLRFGLETDLDGSLGEFAKVDIRDDLSSLVEHFVVVFGSQSEVVT